MDARTLTALRGSIAKWEAIVAGTGEDHGTLNCPLCAEFYRGACRGCPVRARTGHAGCLGSPYDDWSDAETKANARAELEFLRSLLPEGEA